MKEILKGFTPIEYKKHKKMYGVKGSSLIDRETLEESEDAYIDYLKEHGQL